jgi:calpain-15
LLSSISSLAENPERVKAVFLTSEVNKAGCYAVKFYINGEPLTVVVDDFLPWKRKEQKWAFSRCANDREIWVQILEKAWAKVFGTYQRIEGGLAGESLSALTGAPARIFLHSELPNIDDLWT